MLDQSNTLDPIKKLTKDLRLAAVTLSTTEARFLVDSYYEFQENRKRAANQVLALSESEEPHEILVWLLDQSRLIEDEIKRALDTYSASEYMGAWSREVVGIGPVIAAGLSAHLDITRAKTAGAIWRFAGLDPTQTWGKGQKRPWNAALKTLCWKIGESFVKVSGREKAVYGHFYLARKDLEVARNDKGDNAETAARILTEKKIGKTTDAYGHLTAGHLPPAQIHARAKRWAVKLFLAHWFEEAYRHEYGEEPPLPYAIQHLGHIHQVKGH